MKQRKFAEYEERIAGLPACSLRWIIADCEETLRLQPDSPNAGYCQDEILLCNTELMRRGQNLRRGKAISRERHYHETLTKIWTILKEAGYVGEDMLDELRELVNDSKRPATDEDAGAEELSTQELVDAVQASLISWWKHYICRQPNFSTWRMDDICANHWKRHDTDISGCWRWSTTSRSKSYWR